MAPEKTVGPSTTLAFAGIELDTVLMEARLPHEKLDKCWDLLSTFLRRRRVTLQEIQSLTGLLNFACSCCPPSGFLAQVNRFDYWGTETSFFDSAFERS